MLARVVSSAISGLRATIGTLAAQLGVEPGDEALERAAEIRRALIRRLNQQTWAPPALRQLRSDGYPIGLVSDCSAETPDVWDSSPIAPLIDATSFSCQTGARKPSAQAYLTVTERLGVDTRLCVFVGDGGSHELGGATALGMRAIRYAPPAPTDHFVLDAEDDWQGEEITDLLQIPRLILSPAR